MITINDPIQGSIFNKNIIQKYADYKTNDDCE